MRIKSIRKIDNCSLKRYDIQTKNHNFFANGILVHNSLIKVVRMGDDFLISTNGTIDAFNCALGGGVGCPFDNFGDLAMEGFRHYGLTKDDFPRLFKEGYTYIFELTSPYNQVVVQWNETKMNLIGVRDNNTLQETFFADHELAKVFDTPKIFPITTIDECVAAAKVLPENTEGYVVCDANFNRVKVKSPRYVQLHYMAGNQVWSAYRVMEILLANEVSEYVVYFPKFKVAYDEVNNAYQGFISRVRDFQVLIDGMNFSNKKDLAMWVMGDANRKQMQGFAFKYYEGKVKDADEWVKGLRIQQVLDILGM